MIADYAKRARTLVGTRFRAQGRGEGGLDCVGVVLATFDIPVDAVRRDYRLSANDLPEVEHALRVYFRKVGRSGRKPGDLLLLRTGAWQPHLAVLTDSGIVHAHAGLRRVVETPGPAQWPVVAAYRRRKAG